MLPDILSVPGHRAGLGGSSTSACPALLCSFLLTPAWGCLGWIQLGYQEGIPLFTAVEGVLSMAWVVLIMKGPSNPVWDSVKDSCGKTEEEWRMKGKEIQQSSSSGSNLIQYLSVLHFLLTDVHQFA